MIFNADELARGTGGVLIRPGPPGIVSTDSRRLQPNEWFLALSGDRFDGHDYLPHALAAGCAGAIARSVPESWTAGFVQVDDGLVALQKLARFAREGFAGPVVGITGSAGKTTTRAMTALVLEARGRVHSTEGNLNNHVGLPLTILRAPVDAWGWVLEMGMNHLGEIRLLQEIASPTVRLITNVGAAHLEGVGSLDGVARAKGELFEGARAGDVCCVNEDDPRIRSLPLPEGVRVLRFGSSEGCDVRLTDAVVDPKTLATRLRIETPDGSVLTTLQSPGLHLAACALCAVTIGVALHVPVEGMASSINRYQPVGMRQRLEEGPGGIRVINDAYNANPLSTAASLRTLGAVEGARRVALLGDMLELGSGESAAHEEIIQLALALSLDRIGLAGPRYGAAAKRLGVSDQLLLAEDALSLGALVHHELQNGDVVLLKGSRGMAMERVLQALTAPRTINREEQA